MSHLNSARVPATVIFTALLMIILLSSTRTTYRLAPAKKTMAGGYTPASCASRPATLVPPPEPHRACPWPRPDIWADALAYPWAHSGASAPAYFTARAAPDG